MPGRRSPSIDYSKYDRVEVSVRGLTHEELRSKAITIAADYFGLDSEGVTLECGKFLAEPSLRADDGTVVEYRSTFLVYLKPVDEPDEGNEPDGDGAEADSGASGAASPTPGLSAAGSTRPAGPGRRSESINGGEEGYPSYEPRPDPEWSDD